MAMKYNVWCRIEVYDPETDEHEDLDPDMCEYKVLSTEKLSEVVEFVAGDGSYNDTYEVLQEIQSAMKEQFGQEERDESKGWPC